MITGMHVMLYSRHAEKVQAFLGDVVGLPSVDAGEGWPIYGAPPTEMAVHETNEEASHEIYLICDDVDAMVKRLAERGVETEPIADRGWGRVTTILLPGGERLGLYERRHPSPLAGNAEGAAR
jgi:predicted enzyme related to lactoylglutathione lyase